MSKANSSINIILSATVAIGIMLMGLSVTLDMMVISSTKWLWFAIIGFILMFVGVLPMKKGDIY
jgi:hypothetical protein